MDERVIGDWTISSGSRSIDVKKASSYIDRIASLEDGVSLNFVSSVLLGTKYVTFEEFVHALHQSMEQIDVHRFYLLLYMRAFGSDRWIAQLLWPTIRNRVVEIVDYTDRIPDDANLVVMDDCIYSGGQMMAMVDEVMRVNPNFKGIIHLVIPYVSQAGIDNINTHMHYMGATFQISYHHVEILSAIGEFMERNNDEVYEYIYGKFGMSIDNPAIYFDHKVASDSSTFASIYLRGIVPGQKDSGPLLHEIPTREGIERLESSYSL